MKARLYYIERNGIVQVNQWQYYCPGCGWTHAVGPEIHSFNGDFENPTFSPSVVINFSPGQRCHHFVQNGKINYCTDCDHALKGKEGVEMVHLDQKFNPIL